MNNGLHEWFNWITSRFTFLSDEIVMSIRWQRMIWTLFMSLKVNDATSPEIILWKLFVWHLTWIALDECASHSDIIDIIFCKTKKIVDIAFFVGIMFQSHSGASLYTIGYHHRLAIETKMYILYLFAVQHSSVFDKNNEKSWKKCIEYTIKKWNHSCSHSYFNKNSPQWFFPVHAHR